MSFAKSASQRAEIPMRVQIRSVSTAETKPTCESLALVRYIIKIGSNESYPSKAKFTYLLLPPTFLVLFVKCNHLGELEDKVSSSRDC